MEKMISNELGLNKTNKHVFFSSKVLIQASIWEDWDSDQFIPCSTSSGPHRNCHNNYKEWYYRILGLSNPLMVESNSDRANIYYASHVRPDRGDEKLESILQPIVSELKTLRNEMPFTLIYGNLETIAECFIYFSNSMGKEQYYPPTAEPLAKNRLFTQYHAQYPEHERNRIVEEMVKGTSTHRILLVTIAFGLGIDCNDIRKIIHIGVPYTMEDYCQEVGRAGRDRLPARADIFYNAYDISKSRTNMPDTMRNFVQSKEC